LYAARETGAGADFIGEGSATVCATSSMMVSPRCSARVASCSSATDRGALIAWRAHRALVPLDALVIVNVPHPQAFRRANPAFLEPAPALLVCLVLSAALVA